MNSSVCPIDTVERLRNIYPYFDGAVLESVGAAAERFNNDSYLAVMAALPAVRQMQFGHSRPIEVLDILPASGEYNRVQVLHPPMGGSLNPDRQFRAAAVAAAQPDTRVITFSNPGELGYGGGKLRAPTFIPVGCGDLRATIDGSMRYLDREKIEHADHVGPSFGADKAATAAALGSRYDHQVDRLVAIDPPSVRKRSLPELLADFRRAGEPLADYVEATGCAAYIDARRDSGSMRSYKMGLLRASNLAIAFGLTHEGFEKRLRSALQHHDDLSASLIWAENSELCVNGLMARIADRAQGTFGADRVHTACMPGQRHAMTNDIYLNAALIKQGLLQATRRTTAKNFAPAFAA